MVKGPPCVRLTNR